MEQIIKVYGKLLLEGMVLIALLTILFVEIKDEEGNKGVTRIVGAKLEVENVNYNLYTDFKTTYQNESNKKAPEIFFDGTHLYSGVCIIPNYIKAMDFSGTELEIKVSSIKDAAGTELIGDYDHDTGEISFVPGIYTVEVSAKDVNNKLTRCMIQIPVSK